MRRVDRQWFATSVGAVGLGLITRFGSAGARGRVVDHFSSGCYVRFGDELVAVGRIRPGPLHVVLGGAPRALGIGDSVLLGASPRGNAAMLIDIARADPWMPMPPDPEERASLCRACSTLNLDELVTPDVANVWPSVRDAIRNDDLAHAVRSLQGRGAGLTPTGDDVIAGMLLADAWSRPGGPAQERRVALASAARTTELSRSFLRWAGRGQSIEPVHRLATVVAPDADKFSGMDRFAAAVDVVVGVGGTSGRALLAGLGIGLVDDLAF